MMKKKSFDTVDLLKWILGAGLAGAGARAAFGVGRQLSPSSQSFGEIEDPVSDTVSVPVDVTPEQMAEYKRKRQAVSGVGKQAADWYDPAVYTAGTIGGAGLGWMIASQIMKRMRNARLNEELKRVRKELTDLTSTVPQIQEQPSEDELNKAAAYDWLEDLAVKATSKQEKVAGRLGDVLRRLTRGSTLFRTGGKALAGTALASPFAYAAYKGTRPGAGAGTLGNIASFVAEPPLKMLGYILGPLAAIAGLSSLAKGYRASRSASPEQAKLRQFRRQIYNQETQKTPHIRLVPRLKEKEEKEDEEKRDPNRLGLNSTYGKAAIDRAIAKYSQVTGLDPMGGMFGGPPPGAPAAPPGGTPATSPVAPPPPNQAQVQGDAILPPVSDRESVPPPSPDLRQEAMQTPAGQQIQMEEQEKQMQEMPVPGAMPPMPGAAPPVPMMG